MSNGDDSDTQTGYRAAAGALYLLARHVGLTGELFYEAQGFEDLDVNTFGLAFGITAFVF